LTHTDDDFKRANYFFCDGMDDPWLNELLSRHLIVRHASWVTLCVAEDFCMPIAAYTLDDGFDVTKIRILEPRKVALTNSMQVPADILKNSKGISRKRPFDNVDDSSSAYEERPRKKKRIDVLFPELHAYDSDHHQLKTVQPGPSSAHDEPVLKSGIFQVPRIFPNHPRQANRAIRQRFLNQIRQTSANEPTLNPFSLFWNNLLETHLSEGSTEPLTLSVEDLLRAPRVRATIFTVNTDYLGRTFVDSGPASR